MAQRSAGPKRGREPISERGARRGSSPVPTGEVPKILELGAALGNRATAALLGGGLLQRKVAIGPADDPLEREADRLADRVLSPPGGIAGESVSNAGAAVQRQCAACAAGGKPCPNCEKEDEEEEEVRRKAAGEAAGAPQPAQVASHLSALGAGQPLPSGLRGYFEPRFGHDFGDVRLHTGSTADAAARAARARAFTLKSDVVFAAGEYTPATRGGRRLLAHELAHVVQQAPPAVRRQPAEAETPAPEASTPEPAAQPASQEQATAAPEGKSAEAAPATARQGGAPRSLIVADDAEAGPGQMTKTAFLDELHTAACAAAEEGLAGTEHSAKGCPWLDHYFRLYAGMSAQRLESDLMRYVPAARGATAARDYIAPAAEHIRESVKHWAETGELTGVPGGLPGMGLLGAIGGSLAGLGRMLFKARSGGARDPGHPAAVAARLGEGSALPGGVRSRVEGAFGTGLGDVRLHTDATASRLAGRFNARAFTVGRHVAFGAGEYKPGTLAGDTLLAHELAHVTQQGEGTDAHAGSSAELERDADHAAAHVAAGLLLPGRRQTRARSPRRTGLRLQRCSSEPKKVKGKPGTGLAPGLPPGAQTQKYTLDEYIDLWGKAAGRSMSEDEHRRLAAGCVGVTRLNLGGSASVSECYQTFDEAKKRAAELEAQLHKKPFIFSKRFWSMGKAFPADASGKVDMSGDTGASPPGEVNFDYGWYDEANNTWWHANHCDPVIAGGTCAQAYNATQRMKVYQSTLGHYSDPNYFGADVQVFCVAWSKLQ